MNAIDDRALSLVEARDRIDAAIEPVTGVERVALLDSLDRILASDLIADAAVPAHDNAAMDGYALAGVGAATSPPSGDVAAFRIVGEARAGHPFIGHVGRGACVRILTGAMMPAGCDTVVPQEDVRRDGDTVVVDVVPPVGRHRRLAGEDLQSGAVVLGGGRRLVPSDLGLAASIGAERLDVFRRARVAVFSTGNELRDVGQPLGPGDVRDSNRYTVIGMLKRLGVDVVDLGIVQDEPGSLEATLRRAIADPVQADAIVTSGGVSAGDADLTRDALDRVGAIAFWKLAIRPGRPMAFGRITSGGRRAPLFALPGNPVAVMVAFYALVRPALLKMMSVRPVTTLSLDAWCDTPIAKLPGRTEFVRGIASRRDDAWRVRTTGAQGSGILRSMSEANCFIVLPPDRGSVDAGERVEVWPFEALI